MLGIDCKLFLYGLPVDCKESKFKDFLEAVCGIVGGVVNVSIPSGKTYAFVTLLRPSIKETFLEKTLLYCDDTGHFYQVKVCPFKEKSSTPNRSPAAGCIPKPTAYHVSLHRESMRYKSPEHVVFSPDYNMASPKKRRKKRGDGMVWFDNCGATRKKQLKANRKKKKKASKLIVHPSESSQLGLVLPESISKNDVDDTESTLARDGLWTTNREANIDDCKLSTVDATGEFTQSVRTCTNNELSSHQQPENKTAEGDVTVQRTNSGTPACNALTTAGQELTNEVVQDKVIDCSCAAKTASAHCNESVSIQLDLLTPGHNSMASENALKDTDYSDSLITNLESRAGEAKLPNLEAMTAVSSSRERLRAQLQVIIEHGYLGPLCFEISHRTRVCDVKDEIMQRTGLPVVNQTLTYYGRKLCDNLKLSVLLEDSQCSVTLMLCEGSLKGGGKQKPAAEEGATGGEKNPVNKDESDASSLMETWNSNKTAFWMRQIGLSEKYASVCQKEHVTGNALLLLGSDGPERLKMTFQLKQGPLKILWNSLTCYLERFDRRKHRATFASQETFMSWTTETLCSWLEELGIAQECSRAVEEEEINGHSFLLMKKSGELETALSLKAGSWAVLQQELDLCEEKWRADCGDIGGDELAAKTYKAVDASPALSDTEPNQFDRQTKEGHDKSLGSNKSLPARSAVEERGEAALSKEDEALKHVQTALKLKVEFTDGSLKADQCTVRSIFVKRGGGANRLERMFNFIVITDDIPLSSHAARQLWNKIREHTSEWVKLFTEDDAHAFRWDDGSSFFDGKMVDLRDGSVCQIFLEKLLAEEFVNNYFVILIEEELSQKKNAYTFFLDKKEKRRFKILLGDKGSKYHASFSKSNPARGLKWSKYFKAIISSAKSPPNQIPVLPQKDVDLSSSSDPPKLQNPKTFNSEVANTTYTRGFILNCLETGVKDLITPVHELKLFRKAVELGEEESIKKFVHETLKFACACLNERTNGTIHFGVADEVETQTHGYKPREIVGVPVTNKPLYNEKLTEYIDKCFTGPSKSIVHNCVRPPFFIPVKSSSLRQISSDEVIEVDIEPRYSLCENEIFKVGFKALGRGKKENIIYRRHGSHTQEITDLQDVENFIKSLPKLDEERKVREREKPAVQESPRYLFVKLQRLFCANKKYLDSSIYPILVTSKPDGSMTQEFLEENFSFIQSIKWLVIFDFDDQGSDESGLCKVFKSGPNVSQCDVNEAEDFDQDDEMIDSIYYSSRWIFGNGYAKLGKEAVSFKQWNNSKRKRGISQLIQSLATTIPASRAVVIFLLLSKEYQLMTDIFKDFCTYLDGPNQLVYIAENADVASDWEAELSRTCLEEHEVRERGVVGMQWSEFQECVQQIVSGIDRHQLYVTMTTGSLYPVKNISFSNLDIVSANECEELKSLDPVQREEISSSEEEKFYRGDPVTWKNFWFTDAGKNHVLRRDNYSHLKKLIEKMFGEGSEGKVSTITLHHHIGAGASTMGRQALWDFRHNIDFPYRCALVTKIDNNTSLELLRLRRVGHGEKDASCPPVLALLENIDDVLFRELRLQVVEHACTLPRTQLPVCVFLYCKATMNPSQSHSKEKETSVFLEQRLSENEITWFKDKYTEMEKKFHRKDLGQDFDKYASENLISFMIMKENFNPQYAKSIVNRNLDQVTGEELTLLEYTSLLSIYDPFPVFASCFDTIMVSSGLLKRRIFRDWVEDLTHSARIFLREVDCSTHAGTGKAIAIVHPVIASEILDQIAARKTLSVGQIALNFLKSSVLENKSRISFTSRYLRYGANFMLKHRKKYEYGDSEQTKFSPLIEKILHVKDPVSGLKAATEQSIHEAAEVLSEGLAKFDDPMLAQQIARVFYVNAPAFSESNKDYCFDRASEFCRKALDMNPGNSFLFDTMGRIREKKIKRLYGAIREENQRIEIKDATALLPLVFDAIAWFQKSEGASVDDQNKFGFHGELSVTFYLLDVLRCVGIFRGNEGMKRLQGYLAFTQVIPPEVEIPWKEFHQSIKGLRERYSYCMEEISEEFTIYKSNTVHAKALPRQIAWFKAQYHSYFGEDTMKGNTPEERWEFRWQKINQYLGGDIFSSVFKIDRVETKQTVDDPRKTLLFLRKLIEENYSESGYRDNYKDLLLMITTSMALHSPYGKQSRPKPDKSSVAEEYKEAYRIVEKLFVLEEECNDRHKRLYAHLFKVMFLWPRKDLELDGDYHVQEFYDALKKIKQRWDDKRKGGVDTDKMVKEKMYKYMSFKKERKQYTTLFYLGNGSGLDVFVHANELPPSRRAKESLDWEDSVFKARLRRLEGVVESRNIIRVTNPLDSSRIIEVYYSPFLHRGFSKQEVSFYLGFSWPHPIAVDVRYTDTRLRDNHPIGSNVRPVNSFLPWKEFVTYENYVPQKRRLAEKLLEIRSLRKKKEEGKKLEDNQEKKLQKENDYKKQLQELKQRLAVLEEGMLD